MDQARCLKGQPCTAVHSKAFENSSLGTKVYLICLYTVDRLSDPDSISASSFWTRCLLWGGSSVLERTLFGSANAEYTTHNQLAAKTETATIYVATSLASTAFHDTRKAASSSVVVISVCWARRVPVSTYHCYNTARVHQHRKEAILHRQLANQRPGTFLHAA